ncbi:MAG: YdcF family protein [Microcoleaceae cyanobacterium]
MNPRLSQRLIKFFKLKIIKRALFAAAGLLIIVSLTALSSHILVLRTASQKPVDLLFVLGGSIRREIYVSQQIKQFPNTRILISTGSDDPCILKLFERINAPIEQVWLEKCADSTFGNFFFSLPILKQWQIHHIKLITSASHLPRAKWMAQIILGAHGIWVEVDVVEETGIPGNQEYILKTILDVVRSLVWAVASHGFNPSCQKVVSLENINLLKWCREGFSCEHQGNVDPQQICEALNQ